MNYATPAIAPTDPLGTDLALDTSGDLILTPQGDIALTSQTDNVAQMIGIRLQTIPDTYIFGTDLGSQLGKTIDEPFNGPNMKLIEQYAYNALMVDPRISQVNSVNVQDPGDGTMRFFLTVNVTVQGYGNLRVSVPIGGGAGV